MKVLVLGADGYLGWPTAMHFSKLGDQVMAADNFSKRAWELEDGVQPLIPLPTLHRRIEKWHEITGKRIELRVGDICNHRFLGKLLTEFKPDAIIHYAEQPSAPYSMKSRENAVKTQVNNVVGTLNLLFAMKGACPDAHLVKLGTMGEYGTPNIDIEEGYIDIEHNGRKDRLPFPKQPGSFYHLSKVHDSHNIHFACRMWGLIATDLNQGVVYGIETPETALDEMLGTSFHYDSIFGTVVNRFVVQAVCGIPLTVYGKGGQTRGFLNIEDTLQCVELAVRNPAEKGSMRVFNQMTEFFSVRDIATKVKEAANDLKINVTIESLPNPRIEMEEHYYNPKYSKLHDLGLKPHLLTKEILVGMIEKARANIKNVDKSKLFPDISWKQK